MDITEIQDLVEKARAKLSPAELAQLRAQWEAEDERKRLEADAAAAKALEAARQKVRDAIAALRAIDPKEYINTTQDFLRGGA